MAYGPLTQDDNLKSEIAFRQLVLLDQRLKARLPQLVLWEQYYEGFHRLQFATSRFRSVFGNLFREFADNWCELIVNASVERMIINGFRVGDGETEGDEAAQKIWYDNYLDADSKIAQTEAVKLGEAYYLVDQENKAEGTTSPLITLEHPTQAITMHDAANRRFQRAGLKEWVDEEGRVCATLYTPDRIYRYQAEERTEHIDEPGLMWTGQLFPTDPISTPSSFIGPSSDLMWVPRTGVDFIVTNTLGVVPLVPLQNNPTLKIGGRSDISNIIPLQDAVNKLLMDMIIASEFASFAQRWVTGLEIPKDPQTQKPLDMQSFLASVGRVWATEDPDAKFGQFAASDLKNYICAIEMMIQHVAAQTRTPPHYLLGQSGAFPSGDSLSATETGLVAKVKSKQVDANPTYDRVMKLAFIANGEAEKAQTRVRPIWGDPEQRIRSQRIDGATKMMSFGTPQDALFEEIGCTPDEIQRFKQMKKEMHLLPNSTQFAEQEQWEIEAAKPPNPGEKGTLPEEQDATQAARVARI